MQLFVRTLILGALGLSLVGFQQEAGYRVRVKLAQDPDALRVSSKVEKTTIEWILGVRRPADMPSSRAGDYENKRVKPFETTLWSVEGTLTSYRLGSDGALILQVSNDAGKSILVEVPEVSGEKNKFTKALTAVRRRLSSKLNPTNKAQEASMKIRMVGFGFFAKEKGEDGTVSNGARLAPILSVDLSKE